MKDTDSATACVLDMSSDDSTIKCSGDAVCVSVVASAMLRNERDRDVRNCGGPGGDDMGVVNGGDGDAVTMQCASQRWHWQRFLKRVTRS